MKNLFLYTLGLILMLASCVDDYEDANPPRLLDAPALTATQSADTITGGETVKFTLVVSDAPAGIDSISVSGPSDESIFTSNITSLRGQTAGTVEVTYTAPYDAIGEYEVTVSVWDDQLDNKGKDASKRFDEVFTLVGEYAFDAPSFTVTMGADTVLHNDSTSVTITVTSAPAGIGQVLAFVDKGTISLSEEDLANAAGQESATINGMYYAPEEEVGVAEVLVRVTDVLQDRSTEVTEEVVIDYICDAPDFTIDIDEFATTLGGEIDFNLEVNSTTECDIESIVLTTEDDSGDELGELTYEQSALDSLIEGTLSSIPVTFEAPNSKRGVVDIVVTVTDNDFHSTEKRVQVTIIGCSAPNISGTYDAVSSGSSTDGCPANNPLAGFAGTVTLTASGNGNYTIDDAFAGVYIEWYGVCYNYTFKTPATINFCTEAQGLTLVTFLDAFDATVVDTGSSYDSGTGVITYSWENSFGDVATTVLTPQ
ncbi:hypothetical protein LVD17_15995 [Fulvivirga ulvae]|uniref:hypothetical protein n=1 Tax=Fulvivirga ulvae TaxID=2904245 RepID=UPI001F1F1032|nr:hypothetical protein [Fulvivirga ulvae]UII29802.1 hypothetical protein LVD17_15995 [Fulvivirga ulvae]